MNKLVGNNNHFYPFYTQLIKKEHKLLLYIRIDIYSKMRIESIENIWLQV